MIDTQLVQASFKFCLPVPKTSLWSVYQMDTPDRSRGFRKRSALPARLKASAYVHIRPYYIYGEHLHLAANLPIVDGHAASLIAQPMWWLTSCMRGKCLFTPTQVGRMRLTGNVQWIIEIQCDFSWRRVFGGSHALQMVCEGGEISPIMEYSFEVSSLSLFSSPSADSVHSWKAFVVALFVWSDCCFSSDCVILE